MEQALCIKKKCKRNMVKKRAGSRAQVFNKVCGSGREDRTPRGVVGKFSPLRSPYASSHSSSAPHEARAAPACERAFLIDTRRGEWRRVYEGGRGTGVVPGVSIMSSLQAVKGQSKVRSTTPPHPSLPLSLKEKNKVKMRKMVPT